VAVKTMIDLALLVGGALAGAIAAYALLRGRAAQQAAAARAEGRSAAQQEGAVLAERLAACQRESQELRGERDQARGALEEQRQSAAELAVERARLATSLSAATSEREVLVGKLQAELREAREQSATLAGASAAQRAELAELGTRLAEQQRHHEERLAERQQHHAERLAELDQARQRMATEFENLANRILEAKGRALGEQSRTGLEALLKPVREQLEGFRTKVEQIHHTETQERASLREQLLVLQQLNQRMNDEARNLTRALKGDKKIQGNWGEMVLERVLEQSGLRKGIEYELQGSYRDREGQLFRPDVVIHLPEGKDIVVDAKVSLLAYQDYLNAVDEPAQLTALQAHVQAVRDHVSALGGKDYSALQGLRSVDFVLMFMPIEPAFMLAFQHDEKLLGAAFEQRIVVVTPTTLLATLRTVSSVWRFERQSENARLIAQRAGAVYDKLRGFVEEFERLGGQLELTQRTYQGALNRLTQGRGNLIRQAEAFVELGVRVRQPLSRTIVERAGLEEGGTLSPGETLRLPADTGDDTGDGANASSEA
jgi:DNA recombination protein RmuC